MSITVSGILKTPAGNLLANTEIKFYAVATGSNVLQGTTGIIVTGADGSYSVTLQEGSHRVTVRQGNTRPETIGLVHISADTSASTLNELLLAASAASPGNPLADEILAARDRAETAASAAEASRAAAQQIKTDTAAILDQTSQISGLDTVEQAIALASPDMLAKADPARHPFRGKLPSLALEFARNRYHLAGDYGLEPKQISDVLTVSNGASTRVDHRGQIVPTAVNQPVINYDPATGECLGLSTNEGRENRIINSGNLLGPGWSGTCTVTTDGTLSPDGELAYKVEDTSSSDTQYWNQPVAISSSGSTRTASIFVKKGNSRYINVETQHYSGGSTVNRNGYIDLDTGLASGGTATDLKIKKYPQGWYRVSLSSTDSNSGNSFVRLLFRPTAQATSLDVTLTGYTYFLGGQIEVGSFPTRYIKTEASAVTRVDDLIVQGTGDAISDQSFTFLVKFQMVGLPSSEAKIFKLGTDPDEYGRGIGIQVTPLGAVYTRIRNAASSVGTNLGSLDNLSATVAVTYDKASGRIASSLNGGAVINSSFVDLTGLIQRLNIGLVGSNLSGSTTTSSSIFHKVLVFPGAMTDAELQELSA